MVGLGGWGWRGVKMGGRHTSNFFFIEYAIGFNVFSSYSLFHVLITMYSVLIRVKKLAKDDADSRILFVCFDRLQQQCRAYKTRRGRPR